MGERRSFKLVTVDQIQLLVIEFIHYSVVVYKYTESERLIIFKIEPLVNGSICET